MQPLTIEMLPLAIVFAGLALTGTCEGTELCGNEVCGLVEHDGALVPGYCGLEKRCEPCGKYTCSLTDIPPPCQVFCASERPQNDRGGKVVTTPHQPNRRMHENRDGQSCQCDHHYSLPAVLVLLFISFLGNVLQCLGRWGWLPCCKQRALEGIRDKKAGPQLIIHVPTEQKIPLVPPELSLASQKSSSESLRHIRTHPEDDQNASFTC